MSEVRSGHECIPNDMAQLDPKRPDQPRVGHNIGTVGQLQLSSSSLKHFSQHTRQNSSSMSSHFRFLHSMQVLCLRRSTHFRGSIKMSPMTMLSSESFRHPTSLPRSNGAHNNIHQAD
jgi:hypothetical protein